MLSEELSQVHQAVAPVPLWFRYLVTIQETDGPAGLTLGILLALVYLILKVHFYQQSVCFSVVNMFTMKFKCFSFFSF